MKAIILSVRPEWAEKILNGEKTIEIRKSMPKDFVGWVYIYVTKPKRKYSIGHQIFYSDELYRTPKGTIKFGSSVELMAYDNYNKNNFLCRKVVARFWFDEFDIYRTSSEMYFIKNSDLEKACLDRESLANYAGGKTLYGWFIKKLEIFDTPKELKEFYVERYAVMPNGIFPCNEPLAKAPQSWQFIEVS